jgi:NAD-dependent deacetylase
LIQTFMMVPENLPIVVLTGAGISAESGIPTFRGAGGLWEGYDPQELATPRAFRRDPELVWRFYSWRRGLISASQPNKAHHLLREIEQTHPLFTLITQNVDGYHQQAGSLNLLELHGSLWRLKCVQCSHRWEDTSHPLPNLPPHCPACDGLARPDVIWFGEKLEHKVLEDAIQAVEQARLFLSIGTSSVVYPAAELPLLAKKRGAYLIEINLEETPISSMMDQILLGPVSVELEHWWREDHPELRLLNAN